MKAIYKGFNILVYPDASSSGNRTSAAVGSGVLFVAGCRYKCRQSRSGHKVVPGNSAGRGGGLEVGVCWRLRRGGRGPLCRRCEAPAPSEDSEAARGGGGV